MPFLRYKKKKKYSSGHSRRHDKGICKWNIKQRAEKQGLRALRLNSLKKRYSHMEEGEKKKGLPQGAPQEREPHRSHIPHFTKEENSV
jgi:hypothetical protein